MQPGRGDGAATASRRRSGLAPVDTRESLLVYGRNGQRCDRCGDTVRVDRADSRDRARLLVPWLPDRRTSQPPAADDCRRSIRTRPPRSSPPTCPGAERQADRRPVKAIHDPGGALAAGLAAIRTQFHVPAGFPAEVLAAATAAAAAGRAGPTRRMSTAPTSPSSRSTRHRRPTSTRRSPSSAPAPIFVLRYAIADVGWFVDDGAALDQRGVAPRRDAVPARRSCAAVPAGAQRGRGQPAARWAAARRSSSPCASTRTARPDLDGAERAVVRSRAKLAYDTVGDDDLPDGFAELSARVHAAEDRRGASRVEPPEQAVEPVGVDGYTLDAARPARVRGAQRRLVAGDQPGDRRCAARRAHRAVPHDARTRRARRAPPAGDRRGVRRGVAARRVARRPRPAARRPRRRSRRR